MVVKFQSYATYLLQLKTRAKGSKEVGTEKWGKRELFSGQYRRSTPFLSSKPISPFFLIQNQPLPSICYYVPCLLLLIDFLSLQLQEQGLSYPSTYKGSQKSYED